MGKRPGDPEAKVIAPAVAGVPAAVGRAEVLRSADPGAATDDTDSFVPTFQPGAAIYGRRR